jgi:GntR family transcriptional regulator
VARTVLRDSRLPLYEQLRRALLDEVRERALHAGALLETEAELGERFGVSRTVVRQALGELERQGHVSRIQGKGTYVSEPKLREHFLDSAGGLHHDQASRGHAVTSVVLACDEGEPDAATALALELAPGARVVVLDRLRSVDGEALVFTRSHIPVRLGADLLTVLATADLSHASLYATLQEHYGIDIVEARRTVEAVAADREIARLLGIRTGAPVLRLRSTARDRSGRPVEHFDAWHRGDRTLFELDARADPAAGSVNARELDLAHVR